MALGDKYIGGNFARQDLSFCTLSGTFVRCDFAGANLTGATLSGKFVACNFDGANRTGALLIGEFPESDLSCTIVGIPNPQHAKVAGQYGGGNDGMVLNGEYPGWSFAGQDLSFCTLSGRFVTCDFIGAKLICATLSGRFT